MEANFSLVKNHSESMLIHVCVDSMRSNAVVKVPLASVRAQRVFLFFDKVFVTRPQKRSGHLICFKRLP